ncbi:hypothetical protein NM688_g4165 [Phlebia brevispora]|uniref:Uncharacterized protein n=1 Tax=Phlebia brevispora TaxID=194682 RepID=A0ACC1T3W3_9APHY|nr:hypothetical protein NM688_g4165 [Phlebia brevispora]
MRPHLMFPSVVLGLLLLLFCTPSVSQKVHGPQCEGRTCELRELELQLSHEVDMQIEALGAIVKELYELLWHYERAQSMLRGDYLYAEGLKDAIRREKNELGKSKSTLRGGYMYAEDIRDAIKRERIKLDKVIIGFDLQ